MVPVVCSRLLLISSSHFISRGASDCMLGNTNLSHLTNLLEKLPVNVGILETTAIAYHFDSLQCGALHVTKLVEDFFQRVRLSFRTPTIKLLM